MAQRSVNLAFLAAHDAMLVEQRVVARRLEEAPAHCYEFEDSIERLQRERDALDRSLLAKAFRGQLVPHDPSDEPAAVLLERSRASAGPVTTRRRRKGNP